MKELHLELRHLKKTYTRPVLVDVNLEVTNDSYVTIVGKSGSGKSTMLNILGLLESCSGGEYIFNEIPIVNGVDYSRLRLENDRLNEPFGLSELAVEFAEMGDYRR